MKLLPVIFIISNIHNIKRHH